MKKQRSKFWRLGVAVGIIMLCIVIMREPVNQTNFVEETTQAPQSHETVSNIKVGETTYTETEKISSNYEVDNAETQEIKSICLKDENGEFTIEALELAKEYLTKYNNGKWDGYSIVDYNSGIKIGISWGKIELEDEETPICTEERSICDKAIEAYMSGEWDGKEMVTSNGHIIKLDEGGGYLLLDGYSCVGQRNLDIPKYAYELFRDVIHDYEYVPGQGTYVLLNKKLVKFLREEQITLPGEELSWKGFQSYNDLMSQKPDSSILYNLPRLIYNKIDGKLYLISGDETCTLDNSENYVYVFDDCNISKMRYIGRVNFEHKYPGNVDMDTLIDKSK